MADVSFPALNLSSEKFDLDNYEVGSNAHADGKVAYACIADNDSWNDDEIEVVGKNTESGYTLSVATSSEAYAGLWTGGGSVLFTQQADGQWKMEGFQRSWNNWTPISIEWTFCNPDQVFDIALAGLECAAGESNQDVTALVNSLRASKSYAVESSKHYGKEQDCFPVRAETPDEYSGYGTQGWD